MHKTTTHVLASVCVCVRAKLSGPKVERPGSEMAATTVVVLLLVLVAW